MNVARAGVFVCALLVASCSYTSSEAWALDQASTGRVAPSCLAQSTFPNFPNSGLLERLGRGFNLPNWDANNPNDRPSLETLTELRSLGLTHIRLPVFHSRFVDRAFAAPEVVEYMRALVDEIAKLTAIGYAVSIDLHPDGRFNNLYTRNPVEGYLLWSDIWKHLSTELAHFSAEDVLIEFLNEPDMPDAIWQADVEKLAVQVRKWLPGHTFVVGPAGPMRHESLAGFTPLKDPNTVYAIHFYDPFVFTHQGAAWHDALDPVRLATGVPFPSVPNDPRIAELIGKLRSDGYAAAANDIEGMFEEPWSVHDIERAFDTALVWSKHHDRPVVVNEFGTLSHFAPRSDRVYWIGAVVQQAEKRCLGWTHWDFSDGFGFVDAGSGAIDEEILHEFLINSR